MKRIALGVVIVLLVVTMMVTSFMGSQMPNTNSTPLPVPASEPTFDSRYELQITPVATATPFATPEVLALPTPKTSD